MEVFHIVMASVVLALAVYVAMFPRVVYAPVPRTVLFFLLSVLAAVTFGSEVASKFELELPGFCFVTGGAAAVSFGMLGFLTHLTKPAEKIAVFHVDDEANNPVDLEVPGAIEIRLGPSAVQVTKFADKNTLVLIFPEQVEEAELRVKKTNLDPPYIGRVGYAGSRRTTLTLGVDLKQASVARQRNAQ